MEATGNTAGAISVAGGGGSRWKWVEEEVGSAKRKTVCRQLLGEVWLGGGGDRDGARAYGVKGRCGFLMGETRGWSW